MTEEFFTAILEENKDTVRVTVRDALLDGIKRQFEWELPETVKRAVQAFMEEEVIPEIRAELTANKDEFVNAATEMVRGVPVEIGKALQAHMAVSLTKSWNLKKVIEALVS